MLKFIIARQYLDAKLNDEAERRSLGQYCNDGLQSVGKTRDQGGEPEVRPIKNIYRAYCTLDKVGGTNNGLKSVVSRCFEPTALCKYPCILAGPGQSPRISEC